MSSPNLTECRECGAMVERTGKHRRWHEALNAVAPGIAAELKRLEDRDDKEHSAHMW